MRTAVPLLLLGDAGATHTRALVATAAGRILGRGTAGPGNAFAVGRQQALASLKRALRAALASAETSATELAAVVVGSASVEPTGRGSKPIETALRESFSCNRRMVVADCVIALEGALAGAPGVVIVSGTGSVILGKTEQGKILKIGGWGPLFGDEGSAQWIAREGLRFAAYGNDKTGPPTSLTGMFQRHFRLPLFSRIVEVIYADTTPANLGALAPLVMKAADSGDRRARDIFCRGGEALAHQAAEALRQLGMRSGAVSYQGSVFLAGSLVLDPLKAALRRFAPKARLVPPAMPSIGGAFLIALQLIRRPAEGPVVAAFLGNLHA